MTTRILPREDYGRLVGTLLECAISSLPVDSQVVVVEDNGAIVGCAALYPVWHLDGVWVAPAYRKKTTVARRLVRVIRGWLHVVPEVWAMAVSSASQELCAKFPGRVTPLTCAHFTLGNLRG